MRGGGHGFSMFSRQVSCWVSDEAKKTCSGGVSALVCYVIQGSWVWGMGSGHSTSHTSGKSLLHLSGHCSFLPGYRTRTLRLASRQALNLKALVWPWSKCIVPWIKRSSFPPVKVGFPCACLRAETCFKGCILQKMLWFSYICTKRYSSFCILDNACWCFFCIAFGSWYEEE